MISNIEIVLKEDTIISYETACGKESFSFSEIRSLWPYANADEIEGIRVYTLDSQNTIMILLSIASGQGGVVVCWNTEKRKVEHISAAAYTIALSYYKNMIYMLKVVSNFAIPARFTLEKIPYGIKDAWAESEQVAGFDLDKVDEYKGDYNDVDLHVGPKGIKVRLNDKVYNAC